MARALKVYRTPIGFHDAYVAAPSQKAALAAWGADVDLFARGIAETVTDEALTANPLAKPGTVVRRLRGTDTEQLAAAAEPAPKARRRASPPPDEDEGPPPRRRRRSRGQVPDTAPSRRNGAPGRHEQPASKPKPLSRSALKPAPKPDVKPRSPKPARSELDQAEAALEAAASRQSDEMADARRVEREAQDARRRLQTTHDAEIAKLEEAVARERSRYGAALEKWRA